MNFKLNVIFIKDKPTEKEKYSFKVLTSGTPKSGQYCEQRREPRRGCKNTKPKIYLLKKEKGYVKI